MPEYIEREAAIKAVMAAKWESGSDGAMAMQIVASAPAADVGPVVHGRWVFDQQSAEWGFPYLWTHCKKAHNHKERFCPNCGAMMDGCINDV